MPGYIRRLFATRGRFKVGIFLAAACLATAVDAPVFGGYADEVCPDCVALTAEELDEARGALLLADGLEVSFGLERATLVNGQVESVTTLNTMISAGELISLDLQRTAPNLIQIGENNALSAAALSSLSATGLNSVIQNSADQQLIQNLTTIDIVVRNIEFDSTANSLNESFLNQLLIDAVR